MLGVFSERRRLRRVGEAVEVVGIEEAHEGARAVAVLAAEVTVDDELVELDGGEGDGRLGDVGGEGGAREDLLEDVWVGVLVVVPGGRRPGQLLSVSEGGEVR